MVANKSRLATNFSAGKGKICFSWVSTAGPITGSWLYFSMGRAYKLESWRWKQQPWEAVRLLGGGRKHYIGRDFPSGVQHWTKSPYYSWLKLVYSSTGALLPLLGLENSLGSSLPPPCLTVCKQVHPGEQNIVITRVTTHWGLLLIRRFLKCFTSAKLFNS